MVEINNQRRRSSICWRGRKTDNGRQKTQKSWLWRHCRRKAIYWLLRSPSQTCHANPKLKSTGWTLPASFPLVNYLPQAAWPERLLSEKVRTLWHCSRLRSVALYLWLIVVISVRQSTVATISGLHPGAGYGQFEHKADSLIAKFKEAGERSRDWCMSRVAWLSPLWLSPSSSACRRYWQYYRDNAITYKAQRDKKCQRTGLADAAITDMQLRQRGICCARCKMYEGVSWC